MAMQSPHTIRHQKAGVQTLAHRIHCAENDDILAWCDGNRRCSQCVQPCKEFWDPQRKPCLGKCENHPECLTSCGFLRSLQALKQGDCPPPQKASGFAAACVQSCGADHECPGPRKCCSNDCGYTCQIPANIYRGVPLKPRKEISFAEQSNGSLAVSWKSKFNVSVEPVFYLLQRRWNSGIHPNEDESTQWQTVAMTAEDHARLEDTRPNRWYQFRVAAINVHGTRGFTTPSKHFYSSRDPLPPNSPRNLRSGNFTVSADGTISVAVSWDSPLNEDLEIHHYKISWSYWMPRKHVLLAKKDNWRLIDGMKPEIQLDGLHPNTEYLVQVQAISYWGQKRLKSPKSLLHVNAPLLNLNAHHLSPDVEVSNELPAVTKTSLIRKVEAASPYYHDGQLQVKIYWKKAEDIHRESSTYLIKWKPVTCATNSTAEEERATVQGSHFIITGLLFACKYKVTVQPATVQEQAVEAVTFVTTPKCSSFKAKGSKRLPCMPEGRHLLSRKVMLRPEKLLAVFRSVNGSITGEFHWEVLQRDPSQEQPVISYQFRWEELSDVSLQGPAPDRVTSQTQTLSPAQLFVVIDSLKPSTLYHAEVQVLSTTGHGPATVKTFRTPALNETSL
ncbi:anosmin-1-like isoform X2 [Ambystoma mexicanum]|uniref:anosmin-1-like isoform X2 n=1 Tax=Ambystoma mexicanum TaxID=8296 RepID=UPI0037E70965